MESNAHKIEVIKSYYSVSGEIFSILRCVNGMLKVGIMLSDNQLKWTIIKNGLTIGRKSDIELQERMQRESFFMYKLMPIDHTVKPKDGETLLIENGR